MLLLQEMRTSSVQIPAYSEAKCPIPAYISQVLCASSAASRRTSGGGVCVQNIGSMKPAVAIFRQLHHGIVVDPEMAEPEFAPGVLHVMVQFFFIAPLWHFGKNALQLLIRLLLGRGLLSCIGIPAGWCVANTTPACPALRARLHPEYPLKYYTVVLSFQHLKINSLEYNTLYKNDYSRKR